MRFALLCVVWLLYSCTTNIHHGVVLQEKDIAVILPNFTRKTDVQTLLGSPSFKWQGVWYYVSSTQKVRAFFMPKVVKHKVYAVEFEDDVVTQVKQFSKENIKNTPVPLQEITTHKPNPSLLFK